MSIKFFINNIFREQKAFSLIEVVAVIFIITFGLVGVLALAQRSIGASNINKNELIASQLAQEGLELVRNKRDENWLKGYNWKTGDGVTNETDIIQDSNYALDKTGNIIESANIIGDVNTRLGIDGGGYYSQDTANLPFVWTNFYRIIEVTDNQADYVEIKCTVQWKDQGGTKNYSVSTILYNWN